MKQEASMNTSGRWKMFTAAESNMKKEEQDKDRGTERTSGTDEKGKVQSYLTDTGSVGGCSPN